tara:strand:+ start:1274 stop:1489 length:216 start_codon:yes stop_codon:yes gene_type:complete
MAQVNGQSISYTSPSGQERKMPHHGGAKHAHQNSDNSRLYVECSIGGKKIIEEWEIPVASSNPIKLNERIA